MNFTPFLKILPPCIHVLEYALVGFHNNVCSFLAQNWRKYDPYWDSGSFSPPPPPPSLPLQIRHFGKGKIINC